MGIDSESSKEYEKTWNEKIRFNGVSEERKQKIKEEGKQAKEAEKDVNRIIEEGLQDPDRNYETKETAAELEKKRVEKLRKIHSD